MGHRGRTMVALAAGTAVVAAAAVPALLGGPNGEGRRGDGLATLLAPPAAAATLPTFGDCEELRQWYVDAALPKVGPWGFGSPYVFAAERTSTADAPLGAGLDAGTGSSATGTNVQEAGVDEPDLAKTDGEILVRIAGPDLVVVDVTGDRARPLSRTRLPGAWRVDRELLLVGDTVLVVGTDSGWGPLVDTSFRVGPGVLATRTHLMAVDVSDPSAPRIGSHQRVDADLVAAREYGDGTVRVVVATGLPELDFVHPTRDRSPREARRLNRDVVRAAGIEDWLPGLRQGDGRGRHPLLDCAAVRHPEEEAGFGTVSVLTFGIEDPRALVATAVTAAGELAYSSADRLYVATIDSGWWDVIPLADVASPGRRPSAPSTQVHAFALGTGTTTYVASGTVRGTVRDRWSLSEHDGRLRVATALGGGWTPRENSVQVLEEEGGRLRVVGSVAGLGPREQIQSVRWLGDLAVVVTFRQTDPLYTLDLSDPARPRVLGELKIRGFSAYLHPVGDGLLLGLGRDATMSGRDLGAKAAVFDLAALGHVRRAGTAGFGRSVEIGSRWEPRAFTYLPELRTALVPLERWDGRPSVRLVALRVAADGGLGRVGSWRVGRWGAGSVRALPLADGRVAVVHGGVRIVDVG